MSVLVKYRPPALAPQSRARGFYELDLAIAVRGKNDDKSGMNSVIGETRDWQDVGGKLKIAACRIETGSDLMKRKSESAKGCPYGHWGRRILKNGIRGY